MGDNEKLQYEFYKRKNIAFLVSNSCLAFVFAMNTYENIVDKRYGVAIFFVLALICYVGLVIIGVLNNLKASTEPGLMINGREIKVKLGNTLKYKTINIDEITRIRVVDGDNIIQIYKGKKKIPISLYEYRKDQVEEMRKVFKKLSLEILNKTFA